MDYRLLKYLIPVVMLAASAGARAEEPLETLEEEAVGETFVTDEVVETPDTLRPLMPEMPQPLVPDSLPQTESNWWKLLWKGKLDLKDPNVKYPGAVALFVKVYNWADHAFNHYDPEYVEGTGHRWKAFVKNDNWLDSYSIGFPASDMRVRMMGDVYCNIGAYIQYMAVSVGYQIDLSKFIHNRPPNHKKFDFSFTCARFSADLRYARNNGETYIRTFKGNNGDRLVKIPFSGMNLKEYEIDAYYFFNSSHYSQGAAYSFAKYQRRSAGSLIAGFLYGMLDIGVDFTKLPDKLKPYMHAPAEKYSFHYDNYSLLIGYGYNLVFKRNWLYNVTVLPLIGVNHCREDSSESSINLFSLGMQGRMALVWNIRDFFVGAQAQINGHWYHSSSYSMFSSIESVSLSAGIRF